MKAASALGKGRLPRPFPAQWWCRQCRLHDHGREPACQVCVAIPTPAALVGPRVSIELAPLPQLSAQFAGIAAPRRPCPEAKPCSVMAAHACVLLCRALLINRGAPQPCLEPSLTCGVLTFAVMLCMSSAPSRCSQAVQGQAILRFSERQAEVAAVRSAQ